MEITTIENEQQYNAYCFLLEVTKQIDSKDQHKQLLKEIKKYEKANPQAERGVSVVAFGMSIE